MQRPKCLVKLMTAIIATTVWLRRPTDGCGDTAIREFASRILAICQQVQQTKIADLIATTIFIRIFVRDLGFDFGG